MVLPMVKYLQDHGVQFHYGAQVMNVLFDIQGSRKLARRIEILREGRTEYIDLTENDLVFYTNGSNVENSTYGSQDKAGRPILMTWPKFLNLTVQPGRWWCRMPI